MLPARGGGGGGGMQMPQGLRSFFFTIILQLRYAQTHINTLHHIPCWSVFVLLETDLGPAPAPTIQYEE